MLFDTRPSSGFFSAFDALRGLQTEFERLLTEDGPGRSTPMAFALYRRDDALLLRTPLPGVEPEDIAVQIDGNVVTLSGQFEEVPEASAARARHVERPRGSFSRALHLPFEVDATRVRAKLERGVLEIELPRLEKTPPVKIPILSAASRN